MKSKAYKISIYADYMHSKLACEEVVTTYNQMLSLLEKYEGYYACAQEENGEGFEEGVLDDTFLELFENNTLVIVMQRLFPTNMVNVFGLFDTIEMAKDEVNKAITALKAAHPNANLVCDTRGNYTLYLDYSRTECFQFHFQKIEKNMQLSRIYKGNINVLEENGWESNGEKVFMW